jgi:hypothetical protein
MDSRQQGRKARPSPGSGFDDDKQVHSAQAGFVILLPRFQTSRRPKSEPPRFWQAPILTATLRVSYFRARVRVDPLRKEATMTPTPKPTRAITRGANAAGTREDRLDRAVEAIKEEWALATRAITAVGRIVLEVCFDGDAHALLDAGAQRNMVFAELARRVDTLGLGLSRYTLSVATRIAAYDHLVRGNHWRLLDAGRKEDLLPLREPAELAEGARFAIEMGATRENLQRWVTVKQAAHGKQRQKRGITLNGTRTALEKLARVGEEESLQRVGRSFVRAGKQDQRKLVDQVRSAREALVVLERRLARMMAPHA